jgi:Tfp pilus assembly protein PilF
MRARSSDEDPEMKNSVPRPVRPILGAAVLAVLFSACGAPRAKPKDPASETATNIRLAESYFAAGKVNDALGILEKAAASQPDNAALRNYYGQLCFLAGRNPEAEAAFAKALELDPHLTDARNNLGAVYDATGRKDLAEQQFLKVVADGAYGSPEKARLNLGMLYQSQGRQDEAIAQLRLAVEVNPKFWRGHYELASVLDKAGRLDEASREYEVAAPDYKGNGEYHYRIGLAYMKLNQPAKAKEHFMRCEELSPGSESASKSYDLMKMLP